jgi:ribonuclease HII
MADFSIEASLIKEGYNIIAGIDEAGRGPLAGPVVAAAVILDIHSDLFDEIDDSKKITEKRRNKLFELIIGNSVDYSINTIDNFEIDNINILNSTMLAMNNAINNLKVKPDYLLIDGNYFKGNILPYRTVIKGDSISKSIAAASILAKVHRDKWMMEIAAQEFPEYNFAKHKGYATKEHIELIKKYGTCKYHRISFLKKILQQTENKLFV